MANLAALRAAVFSLSAKNLTGGLKSTPRRCEGYTTWSMHNHPSPVIITLSKSVLQRYFMEPVKNVLLTLRLIYDACSLLIVQLNHMGVRIAAKHTVPMFFSRWIICNSGIRFVKWCNLCAVFEHSPKSELSGCRIGSFIICVYPRPVEVNSVCYCAYLSNQPRQWEMREGAIKNSRWDGHNTHIRFKRVKMDFTNLKIKIRTELKHEWRRSSASSTHYLYGYVHGGAGWLLWLRGTMSLSGFFSAWARWQRGMSSLTPFSFETVAVTRSTRLFFCQNVLWFRRLY